eukprot:jgi/Astpho2/4943/Aster-06679
MAPEAHTSGIPVAVVSGASGFIATELVSQLLAKGYEVRGTVRDPNNQAKVAHLVQLGQALPGKLTLHAADLLKEGSFDKVVDGAHFVFHTASPFQTDVKDPQKDLVDPALLGTKNVLNAAVKSKATVKRVVLTSSFAAVAKQEKGPSNGKLYTEEDWNNESKPDKAGGYRYSKTVAEQAAWEIAKKEDLDLCVINPTFVLGPVISERTDATSIKNVKDLLEGTKDTIMPWVCDVRDIARGHIRAAEIPEAKGRHLVTQGATVPTKRLVDALSKAFPDFKFPSVKKEASKDVIDNSKAIKELGLVLHDPEESICDMARTLFALGIAKPVRK